MAVLTIIVSLIVLIIIQSITKNVILAILGALATIIGFRFDFFSIFSSFYTPFEEPDLFKLLATVFFIYLFSSGLDESGDAKQFARSTRSLFDERTSMAFMPMMIGFLPMPGGAMFTAPIVDMIGSGKVSEAAEKEGGSSRYSKDYMMIVNYWFRHVVEIFWPVYPAFYIMVSLGGIELAPFSISLIPIFFIATVSGWLFLNGFRLPRIKWPGRHQLKGLWIVLFVLLTGIMILVFNIDGYIALGLNISCYFLFRRKVFWKSLLRALKKYDVFFLLFLFFVYKNYLTQVNLTMDIANEMEAFGLNIHLLTLILPILVGMSTGITQSAVGITAPLLLTIGANPAWMYFAAIAGVLLSPVHLCVVLTINYYKASLVKAFAKTLPLLIITGAAVFFLLVL